MNRIAASSARVDEDNTFLDNNIQPIKRGLIIFSVIPFDWDFAMLVTWTGWTGCWSNWGFFSKINPIRRNTGNTHNPVQLAL
jgi:hypothetical protein